MGVSTRIKHAWNSFFTEDDRPRDNTRPRNGFGGSVSYGSSRPDRVRTRINSERTIINSIYTRMAVDIAGVRIEHIKLDENGQYLDTIKSGLNECLNVEANIDQGARHFRQDISMTLFTEGVAAILPVDTTIDPTKGGGWDIKTMRVGTILDWFPQEVRVRAWDERDGEYKELVVPKKMVAIVENPFFSVMNEPNSTLQRLVHKLNLLDNVDEISSQGKLDIIIQLPYVVKSETRRNQARKRADDIRDQLQNSTYGIAYTDGTEKITQLNRSVENNLLEQVKYLKEELYNELGLTAGIMNGTADDNEMLNYTNRVIEPIMDAQIEGMIRVFLTKTARSQGQTLMYFQTPFKLIPISQLADLIDVLSRNQVITPNEVRPTLGLKPSKEPQANQLINSNMPLDKQVTSETAPPGEESESSEPPSPEDEAEARLDAEMAALGVVV